MKTKDLIKLVLNNLLNIAASIGIWFMSFQNPQSLVSIRFYCTLGALFFIGTIVNMVIDYQKAKEFKDYTCTLNKKEFDDFMHFIKEKNPDWLEEK